MKKENFQSISDYEITENEIIIKNANGSEINIDCSDIRMPKILEQLKPNCEFNKKIKKVFEIFNHVIKFLSEFCYLRAFMYLFIAVFSREQFIGGILNFVLGMGSGILFTSLGKCVDKNIIELGKDIDNYEICLNKCSCLKQKSNSINHKLDVVTNKKIENKRKDELNSLKQTLLLLKDNKAHNEFENQSKVYIKQKYISEKEHS